MANKLEADEEIAKKQTLSQEEKISMQDNQEEAKKLISVYSMINSEAQRYKKPVKLQNTANNEKEINFVEGM